MSFQYDQYLANHRANVKRGFDWLCENLPDVTNDISDAAWQIEFAHDKSKDEEVMETKFFDGKSLEDIWDDITDLEY